MQDIDNKRPFNTVVRERITRFEHNIATMQRQINELSRDITQLKIDKLYLNSAEYANDIEQINSPDKPPAIMEMEYVDHLIENLEMLGHWAKTILSWKKRCNHRNWQPTFEEHLTKMRADMATIAKKLEPFLGDIELVDIDINISVLVHLLIQYYQRTTTNSK